MEDKRDTVRSVEKALEIILAFNEDRTQLSLLEICNLLNMPKSTAYRLITTLEKKGFVEHNRMKGKYQLGLPVLKLSTIALKNYDFKKTALSIMYELRDLTGETINLYAKRGFNRICIEHAEGLYHLRRSSAIGDILPLYCGASGKLLLAFETEKEIEKVIKETELKSWTPNTITDKKSIFDELMIIKKQGYAFSHGEREVGVTSVAAPIRDHTGSVIAALSITGPDSRFTEGNILNYKSLVMKSASQISKNLGFK